MANNMNNVTDDLVLQGVKANNLSALDNAVDPEVLDETNNMENIKNEDPNFNISEASINYNPQICKDAAIESYFHEIETAIETFNSEDSHVILRDEMYDAKINEMIEDVNNSKVLDDKKLKDIGNYDIEIEKALINLKNTREREEAEQEIREMIEKVNRSKALSEQQIHDLKEYEEGISEALSDFASSRRRRIAEKRIKEMVQDINTSTAIDITRNKRKANDIKNYDVETEKAISNIWKIENEKQLHKEVSTIVSEITQGNSEIRSSKKHYDNTFHFKYNPDNKLNSTEHKSEENIQTNNLTAKNVRAVELIFAEYEFNCKFPRVPLRPDRKKRSPSVPALNEFDKERSFRNKCPAINRPPRRSQKVTKDLSYSVTDLSDVDVGSLEFTKNSNKLNTADESLSTLSALDLGNNEQKKKISRMDVHFSSPEVSSLTSTPGNFDHHFSNDRTSIEIFNILEEAQTDRKSVNLRKKSHTFTKGDIYMKDVRNTVTTKKKNKSVTEILRRTFSMKDLPKRDNPPCMPNLLKRYKNKKKSTKANLSTICEEGSKMERSLTCESFASIFIADYSDEETNETYLEKSTNFEPRRSSVNSLHFPSDNVLRKSTSNIDNSNESMHRPIATPRLKRSKSLTGIHMRHPYLAKILTNDDSTISLDPVAIKNAQEMLTKSVGKKGNISLGSQPLPPKRTRSRQSLNEVNEESSETFGSIFGSNLLSPKAQELKSSCKELSVFFDDASKHSSTNVDSENDCSTDDLSKDLHIENAAKSTVTKISEKDSTENIVASEHDEKLLETESIIYFDHSNPNAELQELTTNVESLSVEEAKLTEKDLNSSHNELSVFFDDVPKQVYAELDSQNATYQEGPKDPSHDTLEVDEAMVKALENYSSVNDVSTEHDREQLGKESNLNVEYSKQDAKLINRELVENAESSSEEDVKRTEKDFKSSHDELSVFFDDVPKQVYAEIDSQNATYQEGTKDPSHDTLEVDEAMVKSLENYSAVNDVSTEHDREQLEKESNLNVEYSEQDAKLINKELVENAKSSSEEDVKRTEEDFKSSHDELSVFFDDVPKYLYTDKDEENIGSLEDPLPGTITADAIDSAVNDASTEMNDEVSVHTNKGDNDSTLHQINKSQKPVKELKNHNENLIELSYKINNIQNANKKQHNEKIMRAFSLRYSNDLKSVGIDIEDSTSNDDVMLPSDILKKINSLESRNSSSSLLEDLNEYLPALNLETEKDEKKSSLHTYSEKDLESFETKKINSSEVTKQEVKNNQSFFFPYSENSKLNISKEFKVDGNAFAKDCEEGTLNVKLNNLAKYYEQELMNENSVTKSENNGYPFFGFEGIDTKELSRRILKYEEEVLEAINNTVDSCQFRVANKEVEIEELENTNPYHHCESKKRKQLEKKVSEDSKRSKFSSNQLDELQKIAGHYTDKVIVESLQQCSKNLVVDSNGGIIKIPKHVDSTKPLHQSDYTAKFECASGTNSSHKKMSILKNLSEMVIDEEDSFDDTLNYDEHNFESYSHASHVKRVSFDLSSVEVIGGSPGETTETNASKSESCVTFGKSLNAESEVEISINETELIINSTCKVKEDLLISINDLSNVEFQSNLEVVDPLKLGDLAAKALNGELKCDEADEKIDPISEIENECSFAEHQQPVTSTPVKESKESLSSDKSHHSISRSLRPGLHHMHLGQSKASLNSSNNAEDVDTYYLDLLNVESSEVPIVVEPSQNNKSESNLNSTIYHFPYNTEVIDEFLNQDRNALSPVPSPLLAIRELYNKKNRKVIEVRSPVSKRKYFISTVDEDKLKGVKKIENKNNIFPEFKNSKNVEIIESDDEYDCFFDDDDSQESLWGSSSNDQSRSYNSIKENCSFDCRCGDHDLSIVDQDLVKILAVHEKKPNSPGEESLEIPVKTWPERQDRSEELSTPSPVPIPKWVKNKCDSDTDAHFYLPLRRDTPSPGPSFDSSNNDYKKVEDKSLSRKEDDRTQQDRCVEVYPETLRQRQRNMAPSPNKVDIKNWETLSSNTDDDIDSKSNKKLLPSVKALRNQFESGKSSHRDVSPSTSPTGREVMSACMGSSNLGRTSSSSSTSSLVMSSLDVSSGFGSLTSSQATIESPPPRDPLDDEPVEPIFRQFQGVDQEFSQHLSKPPSTTSWDPLPLLRKLYYVPETPKLQSQKTNYINIKGYLEKLPSGRKKATFWNAWKRRFFEAKDGVLYYYQTEQADKPNMKLPLMGGKVEMMDPNMVSVDDGEKELRSASMLGIDDGKGHYVVVRCTTRQEAEKWKQALESHTADDFSGHYVYPWPKPTNPSLLRDTLVIDIGSCSIRAGVLASQPTLPQLFFPSIVSTNRETRQQVFGMEALSLESRTGSVLSFPVRPSHKISKFSVDLNAISSLLQKTFSDLKVDPRNYNLQLSVPRVLNPHTQAELLKILFDKYGVKSVNLTHQSILALYAYNATSGIVVDIGERLDVVPVTDGYIVDGGVSRVPYGGHRIMEHLRHFLFQRNLSLTNEVDSYIIRQVLETVCYCAQHYNTEKSRCAANPESFEKTANLTDFFPDKPEFEAFRNIMLDYGRFQATEGLFNPDAWGLDHPGLHKLVHKAIQECSMDIRKEMSRSIFLVGGVSQLPGIGDRLTTELDNLTPPAIRPKVHASPYRYHASYLGACVLAESPAFEQSKITKEAWQKQGNSALRKWAL